MALSRSVVQLLGSLGKTSRGRHLADLDGPTRQDLERFVTFLVSVEGKGENTARVYKSMCAKALAVGADPDNPVMTSALRALGRFAASEQGQGK